MRIIDISKKNFEEIRKEDVRNWFHEKLNEDPDTVFHFLSDLTEEDRKFLYQNADDFIIDKKQVMQMETTKKSSIWSWVDQSEQAEPDSDSKEYEVFMKAGRKYYNKLQKYPIENMGIINVMNAKIDFLTGIVKYSLFINIATMIFVFSR